MSVTAQLCSVIYAAVIGLIGLVIWKVSTFIRWNRTKRKQLSSIPALPSHWLIGNSRKGQVQGSKSFLDILVKAGNDGHKLFCLWIGPFPMISVLHADTFKELLKQTREKPKSAIDGYKFFYPWIGDGLLVSEGRKWERNRKLLTPAFHFDILNGYIQIMNEGADVFLDKLATETANGKSIDVFPYACRTTLDAMLRCSLSYNGNIQTNASEKEMEYIQAIKQISVLVWRRATDLSMLYEPLFNILPSGREYHRLCDKIHEFTGGIIKSRMKELENSKQSDVDGTKKRRLDFLDILLTAIDEEGRGLSEEEIQHEVDTFTFEGHDTTASAISWGIYALGKYPKIQQKVNQDVCDVIGDSKTVTKDHIGKFTYLPLFVKETLRYFSPVPMIGRANYTTPVVIDGHTIPPNVTIGVNIYAIHHNEDTWPNHMEFDPERFNVNNRDDHDVYGFIPFSAGSRNCIGQVFAMNEIKIDIAKVVKRFEVSLDPVKEATLLPDIVMRAEDGIHVCLKERK